MQTKRTLGILLALAMILSLLSIAPATASAADINIQAGLPTFAVNTDSPTIVGFGGKEWAVIGYNGAGVASQSGKLTLLLNFEINPSSQFKPTAADTNEYYGSTLENAMGAAYNALPAKERALVASRDLAGGSGNFGTPGYDGDKVADEPVLEAKFWPLSAAEASTLNSKVREFHNSNVPSASYTWWLRSPGYYANYAAYIHPDGVHPDGGPVNDVRGARPAMWLNLPPVLFTSAAGNTGGKPPFASGLMSAQTTGQLVKFTVLDYALALGSVTATGRAGNVVNIVYSGATTGKTLSAVVLSGGGVVKYYGKLLASTAASGNTSITLPDDFLATDTVQIFVEEANGNMYTDFASAYKQLKVPALPVLTVSGGFGSGSYDAGTEVMISAYQPPTGKVFDEWELTSGGGTLGEATSPTTAFTMPAGDATVTATYKTAPANTYTLTVVGGTGSGNYTTGEVVSVTASVPPGQVFDKWTATAGGFADSTAQATAFTMPASHVTVTAVFKDAPASTYTLTVIGGAGSGNYTSGALVTLNAFAPPAGQVFDKWTATGGGSFANAASPSTTYTMPGNAATVTATYKAASANTYTLIVIGGTGSGNYTAGDVVPIVADAPASGKSFDKWTSGGGSFANAGSASTNFTMPAATAVVIAGYKDEGGAVTPSTYTLTVSSGHGGGNYGAKAEVMISAYAPPTGKVFDKWVLTSGGGKLEDASSPTTAFTMPAGNATVTATYKTAPANTYTLIVIGGTGSGNYTAGEEVTIEADAPASGKAFDKWTSGGGMLDDASSPSTTFTMPAATAVVIAGYKDADTTPDTKAYFKLWCKKTGWEKTPWNWILCVLYFGWIWMAIVSP